MEVKEYTVQELKNIFFTLALILHIFESKDTSLPFIDITKEYVQQCSAFFMRQWAREVGALDIDVDDISADYQGGVM